MALFCKFQSVSPIAFLLLVISVGFSVPSGRFDLGPRLLWEVDVDVHNRRSGDMLPGALCLQSLEFVQRSEHRSGKRNFVAQEV